MVKLSNPLKRGIQTSELAVVIAADVVLAAVPILHGGLSAHAAATLGTVLNVAYVASRGVVKAVATLNAQVGLPPVQAPSVVSDVEKVAEVAKAVLPAMPSQKTAPAPAAAAPVESVSTPTPAAPGA